jgi:hypothetical protein
MFEPSKKPNPLVVEDVHVFNLKKWKKKTFDTYVNYKFQDVWALKMAWVEPILNGLITFVKCHVYFKIEKKNKVLVAKWDSIESSKNDKVCQKSSP